MSAATSLVPLLPEASRRPARRGIDGLAVAFVAVGLAMVLGPVLSTGRSALRALPSEQRAALLERTAGDLARFCGPGRPAALDDHCRELAAFAGQFEECRGGCADLVRRELTPRPTR